MKKCPNRSPVFRIHVLTDGQVFRIPVNRAARREALAVRRSKKKNKVDEYYILGIDDQQKLV
jgi:hypothetical protein